MEIIEISSYTENEKLHIGPGTSDSEAIGKDRTDRTAAIFQSKKAIWKMAHNYTKEAGVRQLERKIGAVCRKAAKELLMTAKREIAVTDRNLSRFLWQKEKVYVSDGKCSTGGRNCAWTCMDKCRRRYLAD